MLLDRRGEREVLDRQLQRVRVGQSSVQVLRGEAGVGKTALLEYVAERASGCRIARIAGVQSEMELAFSPRTVEYHLRKVFTKLDISSRKELRHALAGVSDREST